MTCFVMDSDMTVIMGRRSICSLRLLDGNFCVSRTRSGWKIVVFFLYCTGQGDSVRHGSFSLWKIIQSLRIFVTSSVILCTVFGNWSAAESQNAPM